MDTYRSTKTITATRPNQLLNTISLDAQRTLELGNNYGWDFNFLGEAPYPTKPIHLENWMIVPAVEDITPIPAESFKKIQALYANGIRPQGFVVVHEAPRQLAAPKGYVTPKPAPAPTKVAQPKVTPKIVVPQRVGELDLSKVASGILTLTSALVPVLINLFVFSIAVAAALDPILIAVTDRGEWIEIDRWDIPV